MVGRGSASAEDIVVVGKDLDNVRNAIFERVGVGCGDRGFNRITFHVYISMN